MISGVNIALPSIGKEFAADAVLLSWISTAYLLAASMLLVPAGRLADIHGRKKVYTVGIIIYTLSALLLANSSSVYEFIFYRLIEGVGASMMRCILACRWVLLWVGFLLRTMGGGASSMLTCQ